MLILSIHRSKAGIHIVRRWRREERRGDIRTEEEEVGEFKAGCKVAERKEEREVEESEVKRRRRRSRRVSQARQVSLSSSLHSILGRSCSSGAGCLNLVNQLNKS